MSVELGRSLLLSDAVREKAVARALYVSVTQHIPLVQALLLTSAMDEPHLEAELGRGELPALVEVRPAYDLVDQLPRGLCKQLLAIPLGRDAHSGAVDLAVVDARDPHPAREVAHVLRAEVHLIRTTIGAMRAALRAIDEHQATQAPPPSQNAQSLAAPIWMRGAERPGGERVRTPLWGTPIVTVSPSSPPHVGGADMPIPLMRRSLLPTAPPPSAALPPSVREVRPARPPSVLPGPRDSQVPPPDTQRDAEPVFALRQSTSVSRRPTAPPSMRYPVLSSPPIASHAPMPPFPDPAPVLAAMHEANDRDAIVALLMSGVRVVARRVAVLAVKRDAFVGWSCNSEFGDARAWRKLTVPTSLPSVFASAASGITYLGPLFRTEAHEPVVQFMHGATRDVGVTSVRVNMHPALILLADELGDTALGTKRMEVLAKGAGDALARIVKKK